MDFIYEWQKNLISLNSVMAWKKSNWISAHQAISCKHNNFNSFWADNRNDFLKYSVAAGASAYLKTIINIIHANSIAKKKKNKWKQMKCGIIIITKPSYVPNDLEKIKKSLSFHIVRGNHPINYWRLQFFLLHNRLRLKIIEYRMYKTKATPIYIRQWTKTIKKKKNEKKFNLIAFYVLWMNDWTNKRKTIR